MDSSCRSPLEIDDPLVTPEDLKAVAFETGVQLARAHLQQHDGSYHRERHRAEHAVKEKRQLVREAIDSMTAATLAAWERFRAVRRWEVEFDRNERRIRGTVHGLDPLQRFVMRCGRPECGAWPCLLLFHKNGWAQVTERGAEHQHDPQERPACPTARMRYRAWPAPGTMA